MKNEKVDYVWTDLEMEHDLKAFLDYLQNGVKGLTPMLRDLERRKNNPAEKRYLNYFIDACRAGEEAKNLLVDSVKNLLELRTSYGLKLYQAKQDRKNKISQPQKSENDE